MQEKKRNKEKYTVKNFKDGIRKREFINKLKWIKPTYFEIFSDKTFKIQS